MGAPKTRLDFSVRPVIAYAIIFLTGTPQNPKVFSGAHWCFYNNNNALLMSRVFELFSLKRAKKADKTNRMRYTMGYEYTGRNGEVSFLCGNHGYRVHPLV
jgi:hypothetical protein